MTKKTRAVQCSYELHLGNMNGYGQSKELARHMEEIVKGRKYGPDGPYFKESPIVKGLFIITWTEHREFEFDQP